MKVNSKDSQFYSLRGAKVTHFLQGIITEQIHGKEKCIYALILTPKGRLICDLFIYKLAENHLLLEVHTKYQNALLEVINKYNFKGVVDLQKEEYFGYIADSDEVLQEGIIAIHPDPRNVALGCIMVSAVMLSGASTEVSEERKITQIKNKILDSGELEQNIFPLEYGLEYAIDWDKGCYVGQEVMSRFKNRGLVKRKLCYLQSDADLEVGEKILLDGETIGFIVLNCKKHGLAIIEILHLQCKDEVSIGNKKIISICH